MVTVAHAILLLDQGQLYLWNTCWLSIMPYFIAKLTMLLQKALVRTIDLAGHREHCRAIFARLAILTVYSQYVLLNLIYVTEHLVLLTTGEYHLIIILVEATI